ncbi:hypothetical protein HDU86_006526 [Geranomyces michiganensis]|nr:hypothetical protein HDU86_006526 [Geranomyces michiganensis]
MSGWFVLKGPKSCSCAFCDSKRSAFSLTDDPTAGHAAECPSGAFWFAFASADPHSDESARLRANTFGAKWPFAGIKGAESLQPEKMAAAGFVYAPDVAAPDIALCPYCDVTLEGWEMADDPTVEHRKRAKDCRFFADRPSTPFPPTTSEAQPTPIQPSTTLSGEKEVIAGAEVNTPIVFHPMLCETDAPAASAAADVAAQHAETDAGRAPSVESARLATPMPATPNALKSPGPPATPVAHRTPVMHTESITPPVALFTSEVDELPSAPAGDATVVDTYTIDQIVERAAVKQPPISGTAEAVSAAEVPTISQTGKVAAAAEEPAAPMNPVKRAASPDTSAAPSHKTKAKRKKMAGPSASVKAPAIRRLPFTRDTRAKIALPRKTPCPTTTTLGSQPIPALPLDESVILDALAPFLPPQASQIVGGAQTTILPEAVAQMTLETLFAAQTEAAREALCKRRRSEWQAAEREFDKLEMWIRTRPEA